MDRVCRRATQASVAPLTDMVDCLEQILQAFCDIVDREDIHQAAQRLARVQDWIHHEVESAAADPVFAEETTMAVVHCGEKV